MRSKKIKKRIAIPDPIYKSRIVSRMVNLIMTGGKKSTAEGIVYGAIEKLSQERKDALKALEDAVRNVMPQQEVKSRRVGGATYQVPMPVKHDRSEALAIRWIIGSARSKKGKPMVEKLFEELKNASTGTGDAMKKRDETHRMAEANRAFSHFARF